MKLNLKLRNNTFTFDVTGKISMSYTKDGDIEIVESIEAEESVKEPEPIPVVEPVKTEEPKQVTESMSPQDNKKQAVLECLKSIKDDKIVQDIRVYLGKRINDKNFDDIIAAAELYAAKHLNNMSRSYCEQRIREVVYLSMFVIAESGPTEAYNWFKYVCDNDGAPKISIAKYSRLANGIGEGSRFIAEMLWPHRLALQRHHEKEHKVLTVDDCQSILDALLKGYGVTSIARYFNVAEQTVYNIANGKHRYCGELDYKGTYPIRCVVKAGVKLSVTRCACCDYIISAKRLLSAPGTRYCTACQDKREKSSK